MPVRIFRASGVTAIDGLDDTINAGLRKLNNTERVKEIHTAMSNIGR